MSEHIVRAFDEDLAAIRARISEMGGLTEEMLAGAITAIEESNPELAERVVAMDREVDALEMTVEEMGLELIARRQPMAEDLRLVIAAIKLAAVLERVGDLAKSSARRVPQLVELPRLGVVRSVARLGRQVLGLLTEVLDAWARRDVEAALAVWRRDAEVDEAYNSLFRELVTYMMEDPRTITAGSHLLFVAKNFERIGDHATHVAEMIHFVERGEPLTEERPKGEPAGRETG